MSDAVIFTRARSVYLTIADVQAFVDLCRSEDIPDDAYVLCGAQKRQLPGRTRKHQSLTKLVAHADDRAPAPCGATEYAFGLKCSMVGAHDEHRAVSKDSASYPITVMWPVDRGAGG